MRIGTLPEQRVTAFSRQAKLYESAGLSPDMTIPQPFAANYDYIFNNPSKTAHEVFAEMGIDGMGFARQADQLGKENIGNNLAARIKAAAKAKRPLPTQEDLDALVLAYDFSGARTTSEEGMSSDERTIFAEIKKYCRRAFVGGVFNQPGSFNVTRIETAKEAEARAKAAAKLEAGESLDKDETTEVPSGTLPLEEFDNFVSAAFAGTEVEFSDAEGNTYSIDLGDEAMRAWLQPAKDEAARLIEQRKVGAVAPAPLPLTEAS
jgi:hypothetical protein